MTADFKLSNWTRIGYKRSATPRHAAVVVDGEKVGYVLKLSQSYRAVAGLSNTFGTIEGSPCHES